jgi:hypothetical protein
LETQNIGATVNLGGRLEISGCTFDYDRFGISVYTLESAFKATKVISLHVSRYLDPNFFEKLYWNGNCAVLSWKRGLWEDEVLAEPATPQTLLHLEHFGLIQTRPWTQIHARSAES